MGDQDLHHHVHSPFPLSPFWSSVRPLDLLNCHLNTGIHLWNGKTKKSTSKFIKKDKNFLTTFLRTLALPCPPSFLSLCWEILQRFSENCKTAFMNKTIIHGTLSIQHLFKAKHTDLNFFNSFLSLFSRLFLEASCLFPFSDKKTNASWMKL